MTDHDVSLDRLTADEAVERLTTAAFEVTDQESSDFGRKIVHCFAGGFLGADWDLDAAIAAVREAQDIAWTDDLLKHDLVVLTNDGRVRRFNVQRPKGSVW